eukprot:CAMPEP_0176368086 /NCGR_PEP_ID=MMETSP0126-20121128/22347_1 /TAXON_ID=141414 ORGANISM="Strombidinopsis acuminatum, Strain SPMC142" /NCGR_SAMPLE_ID=MMETSP0126 /ASSEMBLY_ACC=CAM_ASM_000229 /LENGTH=63 /DNA_ID=CAMNT_0017726193 /DNA_START=81 /DNA_END=272 /DNA_ORIENTATION=+
MNLLGKLVVTTGEMEERIELYRQRVCKITSFEPYAAFTRLDRIGKGYVTRRDFAMFLRNNGID